MINNLFKQYEELKMENQVLKDEYRILENNLDSRTREFEDVIDSYKQTLIDIKEFVKNEMEQNGDTKIILNKINDILDEF